MLIDSLTVVVFGLFIKAMLGGLFLVFWLRQRRAVWYAWWAATFFLGGMAAAIFVARGISGELLSIGIGNVLLIAAFACVWQGARAFDHRAPLWLPLCGLPALWFAVCLVPGFLGNVAYRVVLSSLILTSILALTATEFWRGRHERLSSRWPIIVVFSSFALVFAIRIPLIDRLPFPFGALPMQSGSVGVFNLLIFSHVLILTVLAVALTNERLELEQRTKAQTDPLTGALNRRALMSRGGRLLARHQHETAPACLLFLDIDHFKSLNDRFGHSGGDDVLMAFVAIVNDNIRPTDFLFRIGGEEFCCLLPRTKTAQAHRVAERIRHRFETTVVDVAGVPVNATVSLGIASTETFGYDLDTLIRRADMAVYTAKRQGRNQVVVATEAAAAGVDARMAVARGGTLGAA
jgi:diguanylate cyclase (GGDEF)-like protein